MGQKSIFNLKNYLFLEDFTQKKGLKNQLKYKKNFKIGVEILLFFCFLKHPKNTYFQKAMRKPVENSRLKVPFLQCKGYGPNIRKKWCFKAQALKDTRCLVNPIENLSFFHFNLHGKNLTDWVRLLFIRLIIILLGYN